MLFQSLLSSALGSMEFRSPPLHPGARQSLAACLLVSGKTCPRLRGDLRPGVPLKIWRPENRVKIITTFRGCQGDLACDSGFPPTLNWR